MALQSVESEPEPAAKPKKKSKKPPTPPPEESSSSSEEEVVEKKLKKKKKKSSSSSGLCILESLNTTLWAWHPVNISLQSSMSKIDANMTFRPVVVELN